MKYSTPLFFVLVSCLSVILSAGTLTYKHDNGMKVQLPNSCDVVIGSVRLNATALATLGAYLELHESTLKYIPIYDTVEHISTHEHYTSSYDFWTTLETALVLDKVELVHGLARHYIRKHGNPIISPPFHAPNLPSTEAIEALRKQYFLMHRDEKVLGDLTIRFAEFMCSVKAPLENSRLDLSGFHLSDVNELADYYAPFGVHQLDLSGNNLTTLPDNFVNFKDLKNLVLSNNKFTTLPSGIGQLTNLWRLDLAGNELQDVPKELGHLQKLWRLDLRDNKLSLLPQEIGNCSSLAWLWLDDNPLAIVPEPIRSMPSLMQLRVEGTFVNQSSECHQ